MNPDDLVALNEEIAGMARAGLPLDQGLAALAREMSSGKLQRVTEAVANDLRSGQTLAEALERQKGRVPPFYSGLVAAGIKSGRIGEVLATLSAYARMVAHVRGIVVDALFYPAVVMLFAFGIFAGLTVFVMPQFDEIFRSFEMTLPSLTLAVLALGRQPLELIVLPFLVVICGIILLRWIMGSTEAGRFAWAQALYTVPLVGTLIRSARLAAFTELLAILVDHDIPLPEAFRLAGTASADPVMAAAARQVTAGLSDGHSLHMVLRGQGLVPEWVAWMAGLGEKRGSLGTTLHHIADMYRRQAEMRATVLRSVLPPILIILTAGVFVSCFAFAMMLPMIKLLEGLSK